MSSKILILSHPKLTSVVQQVIDGMDQLPEVTIRDVGFGNVINFLNQNLPVLSPNIIITGGAHWEMLNRSQYHSSIPIIPIPVTKFDLLQAALNARQFGKRIAVIHYGEELKDGHDVLQDFDSQFQFFSYETKEDAVAIIHSLNETGIDAIIGAGLVCSLVDKFNIPSIFLHSKDSIIKIMEHVARLETARLDIIATAQKWSVEFMKNPVFTYEIESNIETVTVPALPTKTPSFVSKWALLERFLFHKKISSFFKNDEKFNQSFIDDEYPYISFGSFICDETGSYMTLLWERLEFENKARVFYSIKGAKCRVVFLTKKAITSEFLNKRLKAVFNKGIHRIHGGVCSSVRNEVIFTSEDHLAKKITETEVALELSKSDSILDHICVFEPSNPFTTLYNLTLHSELPDTHFLKPLFGHRNTDKLFHTLRLLLDHGLSITTVANHLGSSRQTVYSLLDRIESLIGLLTDPEKRFALSLELRVIEIQIAINTVKNRKLIKTEPTKLKNPVYNIG